MSKIVYPGVKGNDEAMSAPESSEYLTRAATDGRGAASSKTERASKPASSHAPDVKRTAQDRQGPRIIFKI